MTPRLSHAELAKFDALSRHLLRQDLEDQRGAWASTLMTRVREFTGAERAGLRMRADGKVNFLIDNCDPLAVRDYFAHFQQFDLGRALGPRYSPPPVNPDGVTSSGRLYRNHMSEYRRSEYYCDFQCRYGLFNGTGVIADPANQLRSTVVYIWREQEQSLAMEDCIVQRLRLIAPAFSARMRFDDCGVRGLDGDVLIGKEEGLAFFDEAGKVLYRNPTLVALLARPVNGSSLDAVIAQAAIELRRSLSRRHPLTPERMAMLNTTIDVGSTRLAVSSAVLPNSSGRCSLLIRVRPVDSLVASVKKPTSFADGREDVCARAALTMREREIARLLEARRTNAEIARTLGISLHTVRHHIEHVLQKLGISSRREVAASLAGRVTDECCRD